MSQEIDDLVREATETTDATTAIITLLGEVKRRLDEAIAAGNLDAVRQVATDLDENQRRIAEAILANTPADPNPPAPEG